MSAFAPTFLTKKTPRRRRRRPARADAPSPLGAEGASHRLSMYVASAPLRRGAGAARRPKEAHAARLAARTPPPPPRRRRRREAEAAARAADARRDGRRRQARRPCARARAAPRPQRRRRPHERGGGGGDGVDGRGGAAARPEGRSGAAVPSDEVRGGGSVRGGRGAPASSARRRVRQGAQLLLVLHRLEQLRCADELKEDYFEASDAHRASSGSRRRARRPWTATVVAVAAEEDIVTTSRQDHFRAPTRSRRGRADGRGGHPRRRGGLKIFVHTFTSHRAQRGTEVFVDVFDRQESSSSSRSMWRPVTSAMSSGSS